MLQIDRNELAEAFKGLSKVADPRSTIPILSHVLVEAQGGTLSVTADNMDTRATFYLDCPKGPKKTATCMNKEGGAFLSALDCDEIGLELDQDEITFSNGKVKMALPSLDPKDFPSLSDKDDVDSVSLAFDAPEFLAALKTVKPGISTEETRYYLNGVFFTRYENRLRLVTTDGHRMHIKDLGKVKAFPDSILPRDFILAIISRLEKREGLVEITFYPDKNRVVFNFGKETWESKLIDATYPDYQRVFPTEDSLNSGVIFESAEMLKCLKTIAKITDISSIRFSFSKGLLTLSKISIDGANITYEMKAPKQGTHPFPDCGFNAVYLKDCLIALNSETITFRVSDAGSPVLIEGDSPDARMVLMPIRV